MAGWGMNHPLSFQEARVLGCLLEKEMTTPDYYPLTPAALVAACNQLSNREPIVAWNEETVEAGAAGLRQRTMAAMIHMAGSRGPKFRHLLEDYYPTLGRPERALLAVLLLRGPQSAAELRTRTERMFRFSSADEVERSLEKLIHFGEGPLVVHWPSGNGRRVSTYMHLLCGEATPTAVAAVEATVIAPPPDRVLALEEEISALRQEVNTLKERLLALETALGTNQD